MFGLNPYLILGTVLAFIGSFLAGNFHGHSAEKAAWLVVQAEADKKSAALMAQSKDTVIAAERKYADLNIQTEKDHADAAATIDAAHNANAKLIARIGGLRDAAGRAGGGDRLPSPANAASSGPGQSAGCELSGTVTENLLDLARDADLAAEYGRTCHAWAISIGKQP